MNTKSCEWHHFPAEKPAPGQWVGAIWAEDGDSPLYGLLRFFAENGEEWFEADGSECTDPDFWTPIPEPPKELNIYE